MKILVATDGSKHALHAVEYAAGLVGLMKADQSSITLISVHEDAGLRHARALVGNEQVAAYLRELSEKELASAKALLDATGVVHDQVILAGHVAEEIAGWADREKFDLIVVGSKGRGGIADFLVGSVAQRVVTLAKQPVLVVK